MTYPTKRTFINELGNKITIQIRSVMGTDKALDHSIEIDMEGPNSSDEWIVTPQEACILRDLLSEHPIY